MISEYLVDIEPEQLEFYLMTPQERFDNFLMLFDHYMLCGGTLDEEPDTQSPFFDAKATIKGSSDGRPSVHILRRC